jgi:hypothetical protein
MIFFSKEIFNIYMNGNITVIEVCTSYKVIHIKFGVPLYCFALTVLHGLYLFSWPGQFLSAEYIWVISWKISTP